MELSVPLHLKVNDPAERGRSDVAMFGRDHVAAASNWVEIWTVTGDHSLMAGTPAGADKIVHVGPDGHRGGPYPKYHTVTDNVMIFYGTDPANPRDLGAHVEFHLGEGDDEQVLHFDEPRSIYIPRGVRHYPMVVTGFRRAFIVVDILNSPTRGEAGTETDFSYETPPSTVPGGSDR
jgi:hypothetical protein